MRLLLTILLAIPAMAQSVDAIVSAYIGSPLPAPVSDAVYARRVYLDVWGLLPTPAQLAGFERETRPGKRDLLVKKLLAHRANYAAHWITFWNDHLRNDEGVVYHGERKSITSWLRDALARNLPYDVFVQTLLNPEPKTGPEGFLVGVNWRGEVSASQIAPMQAAQNSAQVFLGVNLKCNSCHDSFISRWKLKDAYGLASYFAENDLEIFRCDVATHEKAAPQFLFPASGAGAGPIETLAGRRAEAARLFTVQERNRLARTYVNRVWNVLFGRGLVALVDNMDARPWSEELLSWLAADFIAHGLDMQHLLERILTSRTYQLSSVSGAPQPGGRFVFRGPLARRLSAEQFADAVSSITGEWRVKLPGAAGPSAYVRDHEIKSTALTRALGRPIRDQVATTRLTQPTTLATIELSNGQSFAALLDRGARRMLSLLREPPRPLFDSGDVRGNTVSVDIDLNGARRLWLVVADMDSYDPRRVAAAWAEPGLFRGDKPRAVSATGAVQFRTSKSPRAAITASLPSAVVIDTGGADCFHAVAGVDRDSLASDISPRVRFLIYGEPPDMARMIPPAGAPPVDPDPPTKDAEALAKRVFRHALGREPSAGEISVAREMIGPGRPDGLADLLWAVFLSPEFQYIR
ncbi:MAG: DUF1549 domain-containing protein [Bryobacteraceae bacterium]